MKLKKNKRSRTLTIEKSDTVEELLSKLRGHHVETIRIPIEYLFNGNFEIIKATVAADISMGNQFYWGRVIFYN